jgi:LPS O-antigen subunit length determinant protein (WzzB/FepE family)
MENALTPNNTSPTAQTLSPRYDPIPIAPKRWLILILILVLAGLGGLMLGVFLALLLNAFRKQPA